MIYVNDLRLGHLGDAQEVHYRPMECLQSVECCSGSGFLRNYDDAVHRETVPGTETEVYCSHGNQDLHGNGGF